MKKIVTGMFAAVVLAASLSGVASADYCYNKTMQYPTGSTYCNASIDCSPFNPFTKPPTNMQDYMMKETCEKSNGSVYYSYFVQSEAVGCC
ncbi:hypothetical protein CIG75_20400 [Tumebacillus algifaecis]|uniref:Uncharacterized protein n=1 Tax=Tumebacillus algifaecis TaxID=1214604 RepID=A0A223D606_9BACL|nr:hypothetical protein [Tumebacillus algifaecis]ASS77029.1 hypothetical protein CIG75_20400 [Tumebacillus algifaecis]